MDDERFGKARNEEPPDPFHDSTSIAEEPPRLDEAREKSPRRPKAKAKSKAKAKAKAKAKKRR